MDLHYYLCFYSLACYRTMATVAEYAGEHCRSIFYEAHTSPPTVKITNIRKGPVYELGQRRKCASTTWINFYEAIRAIRDSSFTASFDSFKVMVGKLEKKRSELV